MLQKQNHNRPVSAFVCRAVFYSDNQNLFDKICSKILEIIQGDYSCRRVRNVTASLKIMPGSAPIARQT